MQQNFEEPDEHGLEVGNIEEAIKGDYTADRKHEVETEVCRSEIEESPIETDECPVEIEECPADTDESHSDTQYIPYTSFKHPSIQATPHSDDLGIVEAFDNAFQAAWGHRRPRGAKNDLKVAASWKMLGATAETTDRMASQIFGWMISNNYEAPGSLAAIDPRVRAQIEKGRALDEAAKKGREGEIIAWTTYLKGWGQGGPWYLFMGAEPDPPDWRMNHRVPLELKSLFLEAVECRKSWLAQRSK